MRFKYTAIATACMALAPFVHAQYGTSGQPSTPSDRPSATGSSAQDSSRMANPGSTADSATIRQLQEQLAQKGFDPGPIDGVMGPQTRTALRNYRQSQGLKQANGIDRATLDSLGVQSAGGTTRHDTSAVGEGTMGTAPSQQSTHSTTAAPSSAGKPSTTQPMAGTSRHDSGAAGEGTMGTAPQQQVHQGRSGTATTPSSPTTPPTSSSSDTTTPPMPGGTTPQDTRSVGEGTMGTAPSQQPNSPRK